MLSALNNNQSWVHYIVDVIDSTELRDQNSSAHFKFSKTKWMQIRKRNTGIFRCNVKFSSLQIVVSFTSPYFLHAINAKRFKNTKLSFLFLQS